MPYRRLGVLPYEQPLMRYFIVIVGQQFLRYLQRTFFVWGIGGMPLCSFSVTDTIEFLVKKSKHFKQSGSTHAATNTHRYYDVFNTATFAFQ